MSSGSELLRPDPKAKGRVTGAESPPVGRVSRSWMTTKRTGSPAWGGFLVAEQQGGSEGVCGCIVEGAVHRAAKGVCSVKLDVHPVASVCSVGLGRQGRVVH